MTSKSRHINTDVAASRKRQAIAASRRRPGRAETGKRRLGPTGVGMTSAPVTFVQRYTPVLKARAGERYVARAYMDRQPGGPWEAWLVFFPLTKGTALATGRETTQGKREHVLYWASGLGRTYLQGALERALDLRPSTRRASRVARRDPRKVHALAEAEVYAAAAARALRAAEVARRRHGPGGRISP